MLPVKVSVAWLSSMMEELEQKVEAKEFFKVTREGGREGSKALIAQRKSNKSGCFMVVEAYGGGGCRGSIGMPEG